MTSFNPSQFTKKGFCKCQTQMTSYLNTNYVSFKRK